MAMYKKLRAFRHFNTTKAPADSGYAGDCARELSETGMSQGAKRVSGIAAPFGRFGCSPLLRAVQSAGILSGMSKDRLVLIPEIGVSDPATDADAATIDELFNGLGYTPLRAYQEINGPVMERYSVTGWEGLQRFTFSNDSSEHLGVVGHAVLICAAMFPAVEKRPRLADQLLDLNLNEGGYFLTIFEGERPVDMFVNNEPL